MILFILLILLWFFKTPIFMPGWGDLFPPLFGQNSGQSLKLLIILWSQKWSSIEIKCIIMKHSYNK